MGKADAPIGIFDSGIGGLSVFREVRSLLPSESIVYFADSIHLPYGDKPIEVIRNYTFEVARFLMRYPVKVVVIACNTASAAALHALREAFPQVYFVGMEPAIKPAVERTHTGKIGVLATVATFQGALFRSVVDRFAGDKEVLAQPCPGLVQQIEAGKWNDPETEKMLRGWLEPMVAAGIDRLVLGCTHYPFVSNLIQHIIGPQVELIDPAPAVARQVKRILENAGWLRHPGGMGGNQYYTTGSTEAFDQIAAGLGFHEVHSHRIFWDETGQHLMK